MKTFTSKARWLLLMLLIGVCQDLHAQTFVHPGIPFTRHDLDELKENIKREPWLSAYNAFRNDARSKLDYSMRGPFATVTRAPNLNNDQWKSDMHAIHNLTFMWVFTGDERYARKATDMLEAWAVTNTSWGGNESMLDIGDYCHYVVTGADILRGTYPGWTETNTANVKNYFEKVLYPHSWVPYPLRDHNKGAIQLQIALSIAAFLDDPVKFNQAIEVYRMDAGGGLRNSLPNGEVGDTGRDDHWFVQIYALAWGAEVAWKQGIDMFAELDNRLLAMAELYNQYAFEGDTMTFTPFGGYSRYYTNWGIPPGTRKQHPFNNIIKGAYALRKGIPTPYTEKMREAVGEGSFSFLFLKSTDPSTATALTPIVYPGDQVEPASHLTNLDIGNTGISGNAVYNDGTWTVEGAGNSLANAVNFTFKKMKGDAAVVVRVTGNTLSSAGCGVMLRESLAPGARHMAINLAATGGVNINHYQPRVPWWLKIERVGDRIFTYHSQDGVHWTNLACSYSSYPEETYIGFYTVSNNTSSLNTATFTNVAFSSAAPEGAPEITSATSVEAQVGGAFTFAVTATNSPTHYSATGLPEGLSLDAASGVIAGTPAALGKAVVDIEAANAAGTGSATLVITVMSSEAPAAPAGITAAVSNTTRISISWPAVANASSYTVKRSLSAEGPFTAIQTGITGTSYTDVLPEPEVNNYYVVTAMAGDLESSNSNVVFASVPPSVPSPPAVVSKSGQLELSWEAASGASSYEVKRATVSGGPYSTVATVSTNSYTDTNVTNGSPYYYVVASVGITMKSANSAEVFGVPGSYALTWSPGPSSNTWADAANWMEGSVPQSPAVLTFNSSSETTLTNDITDMEVSRIQFGAEAGAYTVEGNSLALNNDLVNNSASHQTISNPIILNRQLQVSTNTADMTLSGVITGEGTLIKSGSRILFVNGVNTYSGNTIINGNTGGWPPQNAIAIAGHGTGTPSAPTSGPLGTGRIIMNGGSLFSSGGDATLYNDIEVTSGKRSYMYETTNALILRGRILGNGTLEHDGNTYAGLHLYGDNSEFSGTFITKLRSGNHRLRFHVPQAGSAKAHWLLDANGVDCQSIQFSSGTLHFGGLSGRGYLRNNAGGSPVISIGALNTSTRFEGTFANYLLVEKVGTGTLTFSGNHTYWGTTSVKKGKFLLTNHPTTGAFASPVVVEEGGFGGTGRSTGAATIGTGAGAGAYLEPGNEGIGTLSIGELTLKQDATFKVEVSTKTATADKVSVSIATLQHNPALSVTDVNAGTLAAGTHYTLIENRGNAAVTGTFRNLPELALINISDYDFRISYRGGDGNDVVLMDERTMPLTISSAAADTALIDRPFTYTITAIKSPISFQATGLPSGLRIDTATGQITGTPTESGAFAVELIAANDTSSATATLHLVVRSQIVNLMVASGDGKTILEWDRILDFSYQLKRADTPDGPFATIATVSGTRYVDEVVNGNTYYYVVAAQEADTAYPNSTVVKATPNLAQFGIWKFEEATGPKSLDAWGANHGTLAPDANRSLGKDGQALKLNGTATSFASLPAGLVSTLQNFTIATWVKLDTKSNWVRVFDFGRGTSNYMFLTFQAGAANVMRYAIKNGGSEQQVSFNYALPLNTWTHLAVTQEGNTARLYINGTPVASNSGVTIKPADLGITNQNYLGKSQFTADPNLNGAMDEFLIYSRALSAAELAEVLKAEQQINFAPMAQKEIGDADFDAGATATSGLPVSYSSSNPDVATIVNGKVHLVGVGTTNITAMQEGNDTFKSAAPVTQSLTVADLTAPTAPTGLTSLKREGRTVELIWQASTDNVGVVGYEVFLNGSKVTTSPLAGTSYITDYPVGNQQYVFTVKALDAAGNRSEASDGDIVANGRAYTVEKEVALVYPNPSKGDFNVRVSTSETGTVAIYIYDSNGNLVTSTSEEKSTPVYERAFRLLAVSKGVYVVKVMIGNSVFTKTLLLE